MSTNFTYCYFVAIFRNFGVDSSCYSSFKSYQSNFTNGSTIDNQGTQKVGSIIGTRIWLYHCATNYKRTIIHSTNARYWLASCFGLCQAFVLWPRQIKFHLPSDKLLQFLNLTAVIFPSLVLTTPIIHAPTVFINASKTGDIGIIFISTLYHTTTKLHYKTSSVQQAELKAFQYALQLYPFAINIYTDSQYMAKTIPWLISAFILNNDEKIFHLFSQIQHLLQTRTEPLFISHIRAHTTLPNPLSKGNALADALTHAAIFTPFEEAQKSHKMFHQNAQALWREFKITREQAWQIVKSCQTCPTFHTPPSYSVNPRGLTPNCLWQMDITLYKPFGQLSYLHVSVDTFSGYIFATTKLLQMCRIIYFRHLRTWVILKPLRLTMALHTLLRPFNNSVLLSTLLIPQVFHIILQVRPLWNEVMLVSKMLWKS